MKNKGFTLLVMFIVLIAYAGIASASLTNIGTATLSYTGDTEYNLFWDDEKDLVWLDYTKSATSWSGVYIWAKGLDNTLTLNLSSNYEIVSPASEWRLPDEGADVLSSELGNLLYGVLGFENAYDDDDRRVPFDATLLNSKEFDNLTPGGYWMGNDYADNPSVFNMAYGSISSTASYQHMSGMAVLDVQISTTVPVPGTILLLGFGLIGIAGLNRKKQ